eukprot:gene7431-8013_t
MITPDSDHNQIEDIDCYEEIDDEMIQNHNKELMEGLLPLTDNFEEYFYCVLSFLQDGLKIDPVYLPILTFPQKLYILLNYDDSVRGVVEWCLDGTAFQILNRDRFLQEVVPRYFKLNCFRSFDRQTHLYRFERFRVRTSRAILSTATRYLSSSYCYRHPLFLRNRVEWVSTICRPKPNVPESPRQKRLTNFLPPRFTIPNNPSEGLGDVVNTVLSLSDGQDEKETTMELKRKITDQFLNNSQVVKKVKN